MRSGRHPRRGRSCFDRLSTNGELPTISTLVPVALSLSKGERRVCPTLLNRTAGDSYTHVLKPECRSVRYARENSGEQGSRARRARYAECTNLMHLGLVELVDYLQGRVIPVPRLFDRDALRATAELSKIVVIAGRRALIATEFNLGFRAIAHTRLGVSPSCGNVPECSGLFRNDTFNIHPKDVIVEWTLIRYMGADFCHSTAGDFKLIHRWCLSKISLYGERLANGIFEEPVGEIGFGMVVDNQIIYGEFVIYNSPYATW